MSSSITMAADSTQSEVRVKKSKGPRKKDPAKKKKKERNKKGLKKKRNDSDSDCESDLDLSKELKPIGAYVRQREDTVEQLFQSISTKKMKAMLPEILKPIPVDELKKLCLEQLECMSCKRIKRILQGADPETISSSGTDDDELSSADERKPAVSSGDESKSEHLADSTCLDSLEEDVHDDPEPNKSRSCSPCQGSLSPGTPRSRSSRSQRSSRSRRSSHESFYGSEYNYASEKDSAYAFSSSNDEPGSESSGEEDYIEEVVVEEIVLEEGEDLDEVLKRSKRSSIEQIIEERASGDNLTVVIHNKGDEDEVGDVQVIPQTAECGHNSKDETDSTELLDQKQTEEQSQEMEQHPSEVDKCTGQDRGSTPSMSNQGTDVKAAAAAEDNMKSAESASQEKSDSSPHCGNSESKDVSVTKEGDQQTRQGQAEVEVAAAKDDDPDVAEAAAEQTPSPERAVSPVAADAKDQDVNTVEEEDEKSVKCRQREEELEEGEIEDSTSEEEDPVDPSLDGHSSDPDCVDDVEQVIDFPKTRKRQSEERKILKVKEKRVKKKKVKVIKRIIKVVRRKPAAEGECVGSGTDAVTGKPQGEDVETECHSKRVKLESTSQARTGTASEEGKQGQEMIHTDDKQRPEIEERRQPAPSTSAKPKAIKLTRPDSKLSKGKKSQPQETSKGGGSVDPGPADEMLDTPGEKALNQMEILELKMRARAIKAMLKKQEESDEQEQTKSKRIKLKRN